jgi:peroxiredoxin Q/BCP
MAKLKEGDKAIDFTLVDDENQKVSLKDFKGSFLVLYFYPKDMTSGCTREAIGFSEQILKFKKLNAQVVGISKDSVQSHKKFKEKYNLKIKLLSDESLEVVKEYGVWVKKKLYGRELFGIERTTFVINPQLKIIKIFPKVKVDGHVEAVLDFLKNYQAK